MRTNNFLLAVISAVCLFCPVSPIVHGQAVDIKPGAATAPPQRSWPSDARQQSANLAITDAGMRADISFLADDLLEGRGPGTRGDLLAQRYIISQFGLLGLQTVLPNNKWVQDVPMVGITSRPPELLNFQFESKSMPLKFRDDFIMSNGQGVDGAKFENAELVFVGYGIQAPEFGWDDFKDCDVAGKILVVMNNDPADDPELFAGRTRLYYGRWDYKFKQAAAQGALGAFIIHTTPSAGYPFQVVQTSWTGEQMALSSELNQHPVFEGWLTEDASRKLTELAGQDLDELRTSAESRDFKPVPLGIQLSAALPCLVRPRSTGNVLAVLPGSDPELSKQFVVFMAHHDHLGQSEDRAENVDNIYNGAIDNASGVGSLLSIARAITCLPEAERPKRSILFAAVGAEEQGLIGSKYLAQFPPVPAGRLAAVINIDGINILGPTQDVVVVGLGKSSLDGIVERVAKFQERVVVGDQFPDQGYYYRSDQFSLAKIGVPAVYLHPGIHVIGKPDGWGKQQLREWTDTIYHQPSDEYKTDWDLRGALQDTRLLFYVGLEAANQTDLPAWKPGDEFEAARLAALAAIKP